MSIPGTVELGTFSGQQQSMTISSAIPIRKRRFPIFHPCSPPGGEKDEFDSKNKEESKVEDGVTLSSEANNDASLLESKTSAVDVKKEDTPLKLANKDILASMSITSLGLPLEDLGNTKVILQNEKSYEPEAVPLKKRRFSVFHPCSPPQEEKNSALSSEANNTASLVDSDVMKKVILQKEKWLEPQVPDSFMILQTEEKKLEIVGGQTNGTSHHQLSGGRTNVELSLGPKSSKQEQNEVVLNKSDKVDSLMSLALHEEKLVLHDKKQDSAMDSVSNPVSANPVSANRSNWDLNTTMDVWEGSTCSDEFAHGNVNISGYSKSESFQDDKSLLTIDCAAGQASTSSKLCIQQCKVDDSLGLKLVMPYVDTSKERSSLSDNLNFTSGSPNLSLKQVQVPAVNVSWVVKSEPVDDNSNRDCSIGSCSSSNMESSKLTFVKRESVNNHSLETILHLPKSSSHALFPPCSEVTTSGDLANQSEQSVHSKEFRRNNIPDEPTAMPVRQDSNQLRQCKLGIPSVVDRTELARIDEHTVDSYQNADVSGNVVEQMETDNEVLEDKSFGSDTKSPRNCAVDTVCEKEDEDFEDGEVREHVPVPHLAYTEPIFVGKKNDKVEFVRSDSQNLQLSVPSAGQSISASAFSEKDVVEENLDETHGDLIKDHASVGYEPNSESKLQEPHEVSKVVVDEKRVTGVNPDEQLDESPDVETTAEVVKEIYPGEYNSTLSKVEECLHGQDGAKDLNNSSNKSRIINLSQPKSNSSRFLTSRSVKERYSEFEGEMQTRGNRNGFYTGGSNKFLKDQSVRNSRPTFMRGKGRGSGRFGSSHSEWDSNHNFASESSHGQSDYRVMRRKHAPSISDTDFDRSGYSFPHDDNSFGGNERKIMNNIFPSPRRGSLRRVSFRDTDGPTTRGFPIHNRISRNMSPRRYFDELDGYGIVQENRKRSVRSRTRSPGPRSSPRRRSSNELRELSQRQSPDFFRMGRMRSSDHSACFHDDSVPRRRGSPYVACHSNSVDAGREHIHPRASDSNRRGFYARSNRGADALDSRETEDDDEYLNGSSHSNKYHEVRGDGCIDNRTFIERRGPQRLFRPNFNGNDSFRFHQDDGPKPYRFYPDSEIEFVERSNAQEREFEISDEETEFAERSGDQEREFVERCNAEGREFNGRIHQSVAVSRRIRNTSRS